MQVAELPTMLTAQLQAAKLAHLWNRLSAQHIALGCSCLMGGVSVRLEDFELDIADWLWAESERLGQPAVAAFLLAPGPIEKQDKAVRLILERLEAGEATQEVADWLLTRMTKSIESYAKLHGAVPDAPLMGGSRAWRGSYRDE
jgi:hypothetical protein